MRRRINIFKGTDPVNKATKLVDLEVTKVDFVPAGASQDPDNPGTGAHIKLVKSKEGTAGAGTEPDNQAELTVLQKIAKALGFKIAEPVAKEARTFSEEIQAIKARQIFSQLWDYWYALEGSIRSILTDDTVDRKALIMGSVDQFNVTVSQVIEEWLNMNPETIQKQAPTIPTDRLERLQKAYAALGEIITAPQGTTPINKNKSETEGIGEMKINITKVKPEDREFLFKLDFNALDKLSAEDAARLAKIKADAGEEEPAPVAKGTAAAPGLGLPEDVIKALDPSVKAAIDNILKSATDAVATATAAQEVVKQMQDANKTGEFITKARAEYGNIPGVDPVIVGQVMKSLADSNPTALTALDTVLKAADAAIKSSKLFKEFGAAGGGNAGSAWDKITKAAEDIRKANPKLSQAQAIEKVGEINPELIEEYEAEGDQE
jgi:hypothetical protein